MILLQFPLRRGPEECCIAVEKHFCFQEAKKLSVIADTLEVFPSRYGLKSALISLEGENADILSQKWTGTIQWRCQSQLRHDINVKLVLSVTVSLH